MFLLRGMYFSISFIVSLSRYFSLQITILNSPNGIYSSGKGSTKLAYTSDQSGIWAMPCGPVPNSEIWAGRRAEMKQKGEGSGKKL